MLHIELRSLWKNLAQLGECAFLEGLLAGVAAGQRMRAHHGPVDVIGDMGEKARAIAMLETSENLPHETSIDCHHRRPSHLRGAG